MKLEDITNTDFCVCCGEPVPEGRMVCQACEAGEVRNVPARSVGLAEGLKKLFGIIKKERSDEPRD